MLLSLEHADPDRVAVTGLSGGGWQTIVISSLDTRVTLTNPVAGLLELQDACVAPEGPGRLGADAQRSGHDLRLHAPDGHDGPRPTLLTFNLHDACCFEGDYALEPLMNAVRPIFRLYDREAVAPGPHQRRSTRHAQLRCGQSPAELPYAG